MSNRNVSEALLGTIVSIGMDSPLNVKQAAKLMRGEADKTKEEYVIAANRKLARVFDLPYKRGRTLIKKTPEYTQEEMVNLVLGAGIETTHASAADFVDKLVKKYEDIEGLRGCGFYLTDDIVLGTRKAAFKHVIKEEEETRYKPVIARDNSTGPY